METWQTGTPLRETLRSRGRRARPHAGRGRAGRGVPPGAVRGAARAGLRAAGAASRDRAGPGLPRSRAQLLYSGKVRDVYERGDGVLLLVASDRISAYDHVLPTPIPDKGKILTQLSLWWFEQLADLVPEPPGGRRRSRPSSPGGRWPAAGCRWSRWSAWPAATWPGPGWREYRQTGAVCGVPLPAGLRRGLPAARADLHPGHQGAARAARREHPGRRGGRAGRRRRRRRAGADHAGGVPAGRGHRRAAAASSSPTPRSSSASTPTAGCCWPTRC